MNKLFLCLLLLMSAYAITAQPTRDSTWKKIYRETPAIINDLINTKLDATFDFEKSYLHGKVWITLKPHFYATDSLLLDAKGMEIKQVSVVKHGKNIPLKYKYDGMHLDVDLDKTYQRREQYIIYIVYTAKPDELDVKGSAAITDAKGLYFINPRGEEKDKPTQIWTQGETEATSVWCPTIDKPNQKTTQEIAMTVPAKYVTLSNGKLIAQKKNADGTRTDTWKMELPHAPYLFFMGVGEYVIIKDSYKGKEVSYYVEKEYAPVARKIFGNTPEMMAFFSGVLGVDYPWAKYAQIVGRDYVSGAMENTTATLHQESAYQDARELTDGNRWENVIAHELFHQWFGDYVTTESWSNLTLNESFANYSEYLWNEYKYGKDAADAHGFNDMQGYIASGSDKKELVRFVYNDKEAMFDAVSYNKGGRILHMLRGYVGDSAFFKALNLYLNTNKFKATEAHQLRLAFEEVTGKDLNWFLNQWYFGAGHPKLDITYNYNSTTKQVQVVVTQNTDKVFKLPVAIDIYNGSKKTRFNVWTENKTDTFNFAADAKPDLVNFDGDKTLLAEKKENKTLDEYIHQYKYAGNYIDRREAIDAASKKQEESRAVEILVMSLNDKYDGLRNYTIAKLDLKKEGIKTLAEPILVDLAKKDAKRTVRAAAISKLGDYKLAKYTNLFQEALKDSSYSVAGSGLEALAKIDTVSAYNLAKQLAAQPAKGKLMTVTTGTLIKYGDESAADVIIGNFEKLPFGQAKFEGLQPLGQFLAKVKDMQTLKRGVDAIASFRDAIPEAFRDQVAPFINNVILGEIIKKKQAEGLKEQADYISGKIAADGKKGF